MTGLKPRSTFGASAPTNTAVPTENKAPPRKEIGAIWSNVSKKTGQEFFKVQLSLPKEVLEKALASATGETVDFGLIAFPNKQHEGNNARPTHRIFEDKKQ